MRYGTSVRAKSIPLIVIVLFSFFSLGLYGCQSGQDTQETANRNEQPLARRIGIVKSLGGVKTTVKGTHLLQLDDGSTILLKSSMVNLDDPAYLGKMSEVRGVITYTTDGKQVMEVQNIDSVEGTVSQETVKPQWKTFNSDDLVLSIKYLDSMKIVENGNEVSFEKPIELSSTAQEDEMMTEESAEDDKPMHRLYIKVESKASAETLTSKLGLKSDSYDDLMAEQMVKSKIGAGNYDAIKKTDNGIIFYYFVSPDNFYTVVIDVGQDQQSLNDQNIFYEMLGSLQVSGATEGEKKTETDTANNLPSDTQETGVNPSTTDDTETKEPEIVNPGTDNETPADEDVKSEDDSEEQVTQSVTIPSVSGYAAMTSDALGFGVQYPKNWYYGGTSGSGAGVISHYEFGGKPIDEEPGVLSLDIMTGSIPTGTSQTINGQNLIVVESGDTTSVYVKGDGSRFYRLQGPSSTEDILLQMASTVEEKE